MKNQINVHCLPCDNIIEICTWIIEGGKWSKGWTNVKKQEESQIGIPNSKDLHRHSWFMAMVILKTKIILGLKSQHMSLNKGNNTNQARTMNEGKK